MSKFNKAHWALLAVIVVGILGSVAFIGYAVGFVQGQRHPDVAYCPEHLMLQQIASAFGFDGQTKLSLDTTKGELSDDEAIAYLDGLLTNIKTQGWQPALKVYRAWLDLGVFQKNEDQEQPVERIYLFIETER